MEADGEITSGDDIRVAQRDIKVCTLEELYEEIGARSVAAILVTCQVEGKADRYPMFVRGSSVMLTALHFRLTQALAQIQAEGQA